MTAVRTFTMGMNRIPTMTPFCACYIRLINNLSP